jgi:hypothetical protein
MKRNIGAVIGMSVGLAMAMAPGAWAAGPVPVTPPSIIAILIGLLRHLF